jgi:hypothetical protein
MLVCSAWLPYIGRVMDHASAAELAERDGEGDASPEEVRRFYDLVRDHGPWPGGIERVEFRFGPDSAGSPAVWIVLIAKDELKPSQARMDAIKQVRDELRAAVRGLGTDRWPYVDIQEP